MKRKINIRLGAVCGLSILLLSILLTSVFYRILQEQVFDSLRDTAQMLSNMCKASNQSEAGFSYDKLLAGTAGYNLRVTVVDASGKVLFESETNKAEMENHSDRPEIETALASGAGKEVRESETIGLNTYYFALRMDNGDVIRVARDAALFWRLFTGTVPIILICGIFLFLLCMLVSYFLTRRLVRPIEQISLDLVHAEDYHIYEELVPFVRVIREQQQNIKEQLKTLAEENTKMQAITRYMEEGLLLVDRDNMVMIANPSAVRLLGGRENAEYQGKHILMLSRNEILKTCLIQDQETGSGAGPGTEQHESQTVETIINEKTIRIIVNPVYDERRSKKLGELCLILDVTQERENERMRREFSANVSHELKTPLAAVSGYAELIESGITAPEDTVRFAAEIHKNAARLLTLIEDIIKLSELDEDGNGWAAEQVETVNLYEEAAACINDLKLNAEKREVLLSLKGEPVNVLADRSMIETLITNLCDNAIRYNKPKGSVELLVAKEAGKAVLQVTDTGIGIPVEHQARIFERFYRVDKSRSKATGGTGLGLAIVKHITARNHGTVKLNSTEGAGTVIRVEFPEAGVRED